MDGTIPAAASRVVGRATDHASALRRMRDNRRTFSRQREAAVYSWIVGRVVAWLYQQVCAGRVRPALLGMAPDAQLVFPGESSFGGVHRGKPAIEAWLRRFASLRPEFFVHDVAVAGTPWNMRVLLRFSDRIVAPDGYVYANEGMEAIGFRGGRIREIRVALDTEKVTALDAHL
jgi:ketosteroid isomerase-like protein